MRRPLWLRFRRLVVSPGDARRKLEGEGGCDGTAAVPPSERGIVWEMDNEEEWFELV